MNRERRKLFLELATEAIASGDLDCIEEVLRQDAQSQREDSGQQVTIKIKVVPDPPDDDPSVTIEPSMPELSAGQTPLLLEAGPDRRGESADAPDHAERPAVEPPTVALEQPRHRTASCFEELTQEEQETYAADGWRTCPDHLRPRAEGVGPDYENDGFDRHDGRRGRAQYDMSWDGPNSVHGRR